MNRRAAVALAVIITAVAVAVGISLRPRGSDLPTIDLSDSQRHAAHEGAPAAVPWREPDKDVAALFPGGSAGQPEVVSLSKARTAILKRLGPNYHMETTGISRVPIRVGAKVVGHVVVRRAVGPHGSIELVLGFDSKGAVSGVIVQRQREPQECWAILRPGPFLDSLKGATAASSLELGKDTAPVPESCTEVGRVVVQCLWELLTELDEALKPPRAQPESR